MKFMPALAPRRTTGSIATSARSAGAIVAGIARHPLSGRLDQSAPFAFLEVLVIAANVEDDGIGQRLFELQCVEAKLAANDDGELVDGAAPAPAER